jgi:uncharacterized membrane protein YkgB
MYNFQKFDETISSFMRRWGIIALRLSLGAIFIWFGMLKPLGTSAVIPLVKETTSWLPLLSPDQWVVAIGMWEVAIGVFFIFHDTIRIAIGLLAVQMIGTFLPLFILPDVTFQPGMAPFVPTLEGQYIITNLLIISAALVIGGTVKINEGPFISEKKLT